MVTIVFEPHTTTADNEAGLASGWNDVALSELGKQQAKKLGERHKLTDFDAVFSSDMERAYQTARLAFPGIETKQLYIDWRLRECDYGELTHQPKRVIEAERPQRITEPFPKGESYEQAMIRIRSFLQDLLQFYDDKAVLVIGHRATHCGLDHFTNGVPLAEALATLPPWQPGWTYRLTSL